MKRKFLTSPLDIHQLYIYEIYYPYNCCNSKLIIFTFEFLG